MNLEPLLTARAVITTQTTNNVAYNTVKRFEAKSSSFEPKSKLPKLMLNLKSLSIFLAEDNLFPLGGFLVVFPGVLTLTFLSFKTLLTNTYNTVKPANNMAIPPIPFTTPFVLAKNADVIPPPSKLGICISATEISTLGNPPIVLEADCNESNPVTLPKMPKTPSIPWKIARPTKPITPNIMIDKSSF